MLTRRASEGSEALPSLARRVRMSFFGARVMEKLASCPSWHKRQSGCLNSAFLNISQHFTAHLFRPWIPSSVRDIDGGPRRFTERPKDGADPASRAGGTPRVGSARRVGSPPARGGLLRS